LVHSAFGILLKFSKRASNQETIMFDLFWSF
jgi:hypothetical protein